MAMAAIVVATMPLVLSFCLVSLAKSRAHLQSGSQEWVPRGSPPRPEDRGKMRLDIQDRALIPHFNEASYNTRISSSDPGSSQMARSL